MTSLESHWDTLEILFGAILKLLILGQLWNHFRTSINYVGTISKYVVGINLKFSWDDMAISSGQR